jgi:hypothetical protein
MADISEVVGSHGILCTGIVKEVAFSSDSRPAVIVDVFKDGTRKVNCDYVGRDSRGNLVCTSNISSENPNRDMCSPCKYSVESQL